MENNISIFKKYNLNGPVNIIRLTNNNKILYIFGDYHPYVNECPFNDDIESIDIDKFLFKFIKNYKDNKEKKEIDFFIEDGFTNKFSHKLYRYRNINAYYIVNVRKLYESLTKELNNKRIINDKYKYFRFHYSDIRDKIFFYSVLFYLIDTINYDYKQFNMELYSFLISFKSLLYLIKLFKKKFNKKIILVFFDNFSNPELKKNFLNIINLIVLSNINILIKYIKKIIKILKKYDITRVNNLDEKIKKKIGSLISKIYDQILYSNLVITDLYFIKRFLDKEYIKTAVIYTGLHHFNNIVYILLKFFNFQITHCFKYNENIFYNKKYSFDDIHLLEIKKFEYIQILDKFFASDTEQCSNLFNFPENFN